FRHEAAGIAATRARLGIAAEGPPLAHAIRTLHTAHGGKVTVARVLRGTFSEGATVTGPSGAEDRIAGLSKFVGASLARSQRAADGETAAFAKLERIATGDAFAEGKAAPAQPSPRRAVPPVHAVALDVKDRKDEVRVAAAIAKLADEDPGLVLLNDAEAGELRLAGRGEMHLRVALERLDSRYGVSVGARKPSVAYRESIRDPAHVRARHKKQTGGHGQFADVVVDFRPLARGEGFRFEEAVHGGAVPRQYFSSVEAGVRDGLGKGPLGFPVVDLAATLVDGSHHPVDSSDMAFRAAGRLAVSEALVKARPILLEPILALDVHAPSETISRASQIVSGRRGQILGFEPREGWEGWDTLRALVPESEMEGFVVELRSATAGVGDYSARFDHLAELVGKAADAIVAHRRPAG
ncbi:MAG: elongation factor G, partial [Hyphomicrobiales bacterium]|nr:elongation factor G [Hyphomicrobiales bacterium]